MIQVMRLVVGGETWPVRAEVVDATGQWEIFDPDFKAEDGIDNAVRCFVDIHECDGDPPSLWQVVDVDADGNAHLVFQLDARLLTPEERASVPEHVREGGRAIAGLAIKSAVDGVISKLEEE